MWLYSNFAQKWGPASSRFKLTCNKSWHCNLWPRRHNQSSTVRTQNYQHLVQAKNQVKFPHHAHRNTYDLNRSLLKQKAHKKYHHHHHHHHHDHRYSRRLTRSLGWPVNPSSQSHLLSLSNLINSNFLLIIIIVQHQHHHHCPTSSLSSFFNVIIIIVQHHHYHHCPTSSSVSMFTFQLS